MCPACAEVEEGRYHGRIRVQGVGAEAEDAIRRRIANVAARARFTQPERRVVALRRDGNGLEVRTTSEELAHRITRELEKAFGGSASYAWSHRGRRLLATWRGDARDARRRRAFRPR
jgi:NMD protein affecting ribosome stability and mRNA decay